MIPIDFRDRLAGAFWKVLFADYDGTMSPFVTDRAKAIPYEGVREALNAIRRSGRTRIILVTGRPAADAVRLLGLEHPVESWGCHGYERLTPDGILFQPPLTAGIRNGLALARAWAAEEKLGDRFETKASCVAVHWRGLRAEEAAELSSRAETCLGDISRRFGLALRLGDKTLELRAPGFDKGLPVRTVMAEMPPGTACAFLGDDRTDEDGFQTVNVFGGLSVLVRPEYRPTNARHHLRPPGELLEFLRGWLPNTHAA